MELDGAKVQSLLLLGLAPGENNGFVAHLVGKLNGQVTKPTDANDANAVANRKIRAVEGAKDSGATAHERTSIFGRNLVGDLEEGGDIPCGVGAETSLIMVGSTEIGRVQTVVLATCSCWLND